MGGTVQQGSKVLLGGHFIWNNLCYWQKSNRKTPESALRLTSLRLIVKSSIQSVVMKGAKPLLRRKVKYLCFGLVHSWFIYPVENGPNLTMSRCALVCWFQMYKKLISFLIYIFQGRIHQIEYAMEAVKQVNMSSKWLMSPRYHCCQSKTVLGESLTASEL